MKKIIFFYCLTGLVWFKSAIVLSQCPVTVNAGEDIILCSPPGAVELNGAIDGSFVDFQWTPAWLIA